jgi:NADP-dependent 3-hydroxy acid dehydrogenase YdfG
MAYSSGRSLVGNVAIITGAGRGAGRAIALRLAAAGMRIVAVALTPAHVEAVAAEIARMGGECEPVAADVSREADVRRMTDRALARFGRIDVLVNNAGIGLRASVAEMALSDWERVLATNLTGVFLCSREVLPAMRRQGGGVIINISSGAGKQGYPMMAAYCASRHWPLKSVMSILRSAPLRLVQWLLSLAASRPKRGQLAIRRLKYSFQTISLTPSSTCSSNLTLPGHKR